MKKILLIGGVIVILVGYIVFQKYQPKENTIKSAPALLPTATPASSSADTGIATPTVATASSGYKSGSYTGTAILTDGGYGTVQVKAVIQDGKITDVQFVQYPDHPGHTIEVSQSAMPVLKQEAITAQDAQVAIVSGATQTTQAFIQSLQSALDQAKS